MGFDRNYDRLLERAAVLGQFGGFLDTQEEKAFQAAQREYAKELNRTAYSILSEKPDLELVYQRIREDLAGIGEELPELSDTCTFVAEDLIKKLDEESNKSPLRRSVVRYGGIGALVALVIGYFGIWFYNDLSVDQKIETKTGLIQHAAAYDKVRNYQDWSDTQMRRGGFLKGILLKPWEPDEEEVTAAENFIGLTFGGLDELSKQNVACNAQHLLAASEISEDHLELLDKVSAYVQDGKTEWQDPPVTTIVQPLLEDHGCPDEGVEREGER